MRPRLIIEFDDDKLKGEFIGWLSDGGGEQSFNMVEHFANFDYQGKDKIVLSNPL